MSVNRGFPKVTPAQPDSDWTLDNRSAVACGQCGRTVPAGTAHIVLAPVIPGSNWSPPEGHVMYCPEHCPCRQAAP